LQPNWPLPFAQKDWEHTPPAVQEHLLTLQNRANQLQQPLDARQGQLNNTFHTSSKWPASEAGPRKRNMVCATGGCPAGIGFAAQHAHCHRRRRRGCRPPAGPEWQRPCAWDLFPIGDRSSSVVIPALMAQGADKIASLDICGAIHLPGGSGNVAQRVAEQAIGEDIVQDTLPCDLTYAVVHRGHTVTRLGDSVSVPAPPMHLRREHFR
jgi:hypothetical protein